MAVPADNDMIMDGDAEWAGRVDDQLGHLDIGARRRRIARRVIVHEAIQSNHVIDLYRETLIRKTPWCRYLGSVWHA